MKIIVVGLGNSLLSDDGVGLQVAARLRRVLPAGAGVDVIELQAGGLRLMEALVGYHRAIIVDAMCSCACPPGSVRSLPLAATPATRNLGCAHDGDLATALVYGRDLGMQLPEQIEIIGIEAREVEIFSETLTDQVAAAIPNVMALLLQRLGLS